MERPAVADEGWQLGSDQGSRPGSQADLRQQSTGSGAGTGGQPDLRQQLSGSIANNLIHVEEPDPEQQPLRRQNNPTANRERFQHNQRTAAQGVVQRSWWVLLIVVILGSMLFVAWLYLYFRGWSVWRSYRKQPCDQPFARWLLIMLLLPLCALCVECFSCRKTRVLVIIITLLVLIAGFRMFYKSETCDTTNPHLYRFVRHYLIFLAVWWISWVVMPLIFMAVVLYGMWHGWFDELNGASPDTIKNLETVAFDQCNFAEEGKPDDGRPVPECCICTETFVAKAEIKRTPCQHYFHEECLGRWLRVATTCPLCRNNLDGSAQGDHSPAPARGGLPWMPEAASSAREAEEVQQLLTFFPDLDEVTALHAVRQSGSAEAAAAILGGP